MHHNETSPYHVKLEDIAETVLVPAKYLSGGAIGARIAYGKETSIMVATRDAGYHSKPHAHDSEQLNYVLDGEIYIFVDDDGFLCRKGDIFRVPANAMHWSWVRGDGPCTLLEVHTPGLLGDPDVLDTAHSLLGPAERDFSSVPTLWPENVDREPVERKVLGDQYDIAAAS